MASTANSITFSLVLLVLVMAALTVLQIFLSRGAHRWPGLVLPGVWLLLSLLLVVGNTLYVGSLWQTLGGMAVALLLFNIPTLLLVAVYCVVRARMRRREQIDKMNIHDL